MGNGVPASTFVTDVYKTPLIQTITWFLLAAAIICTLCRAYTKWAVIRIIAVDDFMVPAALLFLIGQSLAITVATVNGLGKPVAELSSDKINVILKAQYAAMLLYIPSLLLSKIPTLVLLNLICPVKTFRYLFMISGILVLGWDVSSELVYAFQCRPPATWDYIHGSLINRKVFSTYFETLNALMDIVLILLPTAIVCRVKTSFHRKASVLAVFSVRFLPLGTSVAKIVLQFPDFTSEDLLFDSWPSTICTQVIQFLSLMAACMLYLRPFLKALTSGFINGDDLRRRGQIRPYIIISDNLPVNLAPKAHIDSSGSSSRYMTRMMRIEADRTLAEGAKSPEPKAPDIERAEDDDLGDSAAAAGATLNATATDSAGLALAEDNPELDSHGPLQGDNQLP